MLTSTTVPHQVNNILGSIADPLPDEMQGQAVDVLVALSGSADKEAPLSQQKDFVAGALATTVGIMKASHEHQITCFLQRTKVPSTDFTG